LRNWVAGRDCGAARIGKESLRRLALERSGRILVGCYRAFGFGYTIAATFIPSGGTFMVMTVAEHQKRDGSRKGRR